jgi:probable HAF family extracellular repeat protein
MTMRVVWGLAVVVMFLSMTGAPTTVAARSAGKFRVIELEVPGGCPGSPIAINNRRDVVGIADDPPDSCGDTTAALWRRGAMTNLGLHVATDINDRGQVIGFFDLGILRAFIWDRGVRTDITLGGDSVANAINQRGHVVGRSTLGPSDSPQPNPFHAYVFHDGSIADLGALPGHNESSANDINERGQIVGFSAG